MNGEQTAIASRRLCISKSKDSLFCLAIWVLGISMSCPLAFAMTNTEDNYGCYSTLSDTKQKIYSVLVFLTAWLIPASLCILIYAHILRKIFRCSRGIRSSANEQSQSASFSQPSSTNDAMISRLAIVKIMAVITIIYWFFHLPFWVIYISDSLQLFETPKVVRAWSVAVTYLNSAINPFVYLMLSQKKALKIFFCFLKFLFCSIYCELMYLVLCTDAYDNHFATADYYDSSKSGDNDEDPGPDLETPMNFGCPPSGETGQMEKSDKSPKRVPSKKCKTEASKPAQLIQHVPETHSWINGITGENSPRVAENKRKKISLQVTGNLPVLGDGRKISLQVRLSSDRNMQPQPNPNTTGLSAISSV